MLPKWVVNLCMNAMSIMNIPDSLQHSDLWLLVSKNWPHENWVCHRQIASKFLRLLLQVCRKLYLVQLTLDCQQVL